MWALLTVWVCVSLVWVGGGGRCVWGGGGVEGWGGGGPGRMRSDRYARWFVNDFFLLFGQGDGRAPLVSGLWGKRPRRLPCICR